MIRVLVVDDHAVVRHGLTSLLEAADDIDCVGATGDGSTVLDLVERLDPEVLLLDLSMPGQDGMSVLRSLPPDTRLRVLVLTSFGGADLVREALHAGAHGYLLKHSEAETILDGIRAIASGGSPLDPMVAASLITDIRGRGEVALLTNREREVIELVRQGHPNKVIARRLAISERTVKAHVTHIMQRIGVSDRTQAALWAERHLHAVRALEGNP